MSTSPGAATKPRRWSRWLGAVVLAAALFGIGVLIWIVPTGRAIITGSDRRNQADLSVAAAGLEQFSGAIVGLARANFIASRVQALAADERDFAEGWRFRTWQRNPMLDEFKINYVVTTAAGCDAIRATIARTEGKLPFVDNYNGGTAGFLKIVDSFPLALIKTEDLRGTAATDAAYLRSIHPAAAIEPGPDARPRPATATATATATAPAVVCFAAGIPVDRLLVLDKAARGFSNLLVIDAAGRVATQVGTDRLPIKSLAGLVPETSVLARSLAATVGQAAPATPQARLADSLRPVDLDISGRTYTAYVRPLLPPDSFEACKPIRRTTLQPVTLGVGSPGDDGARRITLSPATDAAADTADPALPAMKTAATECLVVALVPKARVWSQVITLPTAILLGLGILVVIGFALLPSLRLILLGPGEALGRAEAIGVVLGLPAVVSMVTLALLFAADLGAHRGSAEQRARALAIAAAETAAAEVRTAARTLATTAAATRRADLGPFIGSVPGVDPVPLAYPPDFCRKWPGSDLPVLDSLGILDEDGRAAIGTRTIACRDFLGGRSNVSARDYFRRLRTGDAALIDGKVGDTPYVIAQVNALQDGVSKSVLAMPTGVTDVAPGHISQRRAAVYVVGTATLASLLAPVLPPPFGLMVVDTREDALPVLIHPAPGRAGAEKLALMLRNPADIRDKLRLLHATTGPGPPPTDTFTAFYDGADRRFVAAPIAGTRWVAVASYSLADIDAAASGTAIHALKSWAAFSIVFTLAWVTWLALRGRHGWPRLWPREAHRARYRRLRNQLALLAALAAPLVFIAGAWAPTLFLIAGLLVRLAAALWLHLVLARQPGSRTGRPPSRLLVALGLEPALQRIDALPAQPGPLRPETQRLYKHMVIALIACLSFVPMLGFWREAHEHAGEQARRAAFVALTADDGPLALNAHGIDRLRWAYGIARTPPGATAPIPGAHGVAIVPGPSSTAPATPGEATAISAFFDTIAGDAHLPAVRHCAAGPDSDIDVQLCTGNSTTPDGIEVATPRWSDIDPLLLIAMALAAAGATALLHWLLERVLRGLAGFGIALEAFEPPSVFIGDLFSPRLDRPAGDPTDPQLLELNRKSLLVNAPAVVVRMLRHGRTRLQEINVADQMLVASPIVEGMVVVVSGLELVIADPRRRVRALELLESQSAAIARLGAGTRSRLLVLSESAPLERILDAFERDESRTGVDIERENLRWSRLFEGFASYSFRQARLTGSASLPQRIRVTAMLCARAMPHDAGRQSAIKATVTTVTAACEELRWLPQDVAAAAIGQELLLGPAVLSTGLVPVPDAVYQRRFEVPIVTWAARRRFPGKAAVRAHIRNQCIEYYQKLWSSSTHAEHLVMHHLAAGRFANIGIAMAFGSLVRRGIIVFDPEPRLMNHSFAIFVRQAEKLDTIRSWQGDLPPSAWVMARLPIFAVIGVLAAGIVAVVALSGESLGALLPVLAAGIPALVAAGQRLFSR